MSPPLLLDPFVNTLGFAVGRVTGVVQEFAFFFARRAGVRWFIGFEGISAVVAFPAWHNDHLLLACVAALRRRVSSATVRVDQ
jgi:hypothetical protein